MLDKQILHSAPGSSTNLKERWHERNLDLDAVEDNLIRSKESVPTELDLLEVPMVLGNVFKALMGTVSLESQHSLAAMRAV